MDGSLNKRSTCSRSNLYLAHISVCVCGYTYICVCVLPTVWQQYCKYHAVEPRHTLSVLSVMSPARRRLAPSLILATSTSGDGDVEGPNPHVSSWTDNLKSVSTSTLKPWRVWGIHVFRSQLPLMLPVRFEDEKHVTAYISSKIGGFKFFNGQHCLARDNLSKT